MTFSPPCALAVQERKIPAEIRSLDRWLVWRWHRNPQGKWTKPPVNPRTFRFFANWLDPDNWLSFSEAIETYHAGQVAGIGFVLGDGYAGVDLDKCIDGETIAPRAALIMDYLRSYAEVSPSGKGIKIIVRASGDWNKNDNAGLEIYGRGRYFALTGNSLGVNVIAHRQRQVEVLYATFFGELPNTSKRQGHRGERETKAGDLRNLPKSVRVRPLSSLQNHEIEYLNRFMEKSDRSLVGKRSKENFGLLCQAVRYRLDPAEVWELVKHSSKFAEQGQAYFARTWNNAFNLIKNGHMYEL